VVTDDELRQIMPRLPGAKRAGFLPFLTAAMAEFEINTHLREAAFLAQLAHESGELKFMEEIWGPTPAQIRYEGRADLGNTHPGDGKRFKGRGPIQLTGRANYVTFGKKLGVDLVGNPALAATKEVAFRIAAQFWKDKGLNPLADQSNFREITRRINGGFNGLADREMYYQRAKMVLSKNDPVTGASASTPVQVVVNGTVVTGAKGILRDGHVLVALRPVAAAAALAIIDTSQGRALLQDRNSANVRVPLIIENGVGMVALRDLPGTVKWDEATQTASLTTP
jgi:predicted chitinase